MEKASTAHDEQFAPESGLVHKWADKDLSRHEVHPVVEEVALERNFSFLSSLGLAFTLLNSWSAMSGSWVLPRHR
jgi:hypothetical protein